MRGSRRTRLTLVLLLLTAFTLTALDYNSAQSGPLASLRRGIDTVFGPVQSALGKATNSVGDALGGLPRLGSYKSDNKKQKAEIAALKGQLANQSGTQCKLDQFYAMANFATYTGYKVLPAEVVSVGSASAFEWTATIDVGSIDGVRKDMTVTTGAGLVGRTLQPSARTTTVLLIADPKFTVGGTLVGQSTVGFATGKGAGPMVFSLPDQGLSVRKGAVLLTTGDDTYATGVPIGTVTSVTPDDNGFSKTVGIAPYVDVRSLELVGVITDKARTTPRRPLLPTKPGASPTSSPCPAAVPQGPVPTSRPTPTPAPHVTLSPTPTRTP